MNISYNSLKEYLDFDLSPNEVLNALTDIGLETGSVEEVQAIKGGLEGLVIGEVLTCVEHPNSDHLHLTTVNIGDGNEPLKIVCGAPNVAAGQKVVVATIGTILYDGDKEFVIKRSKIRGEESFGMICAEDEIGIGTSHDGIMVLPDTAIPGTPAKDYFNIKSDYVLEVDITPNRVDATSHIGVARDLAAYLKQQGVNSLLRIPSVDNFAIEDQSSFIPVQVDNSEACIRYSGVQIKGVQVKESPDWLKNYLLVLGLRPINNVVDITNFVLHEYGQPLHAFDVSHIKGGKVVVKTMPEGTKFITLDGVERTLTERDLMICDTEAPMCIAGVLGGLDSGVTESTTDVFLESACFHPSWVRKTARRFGLNTDASFRFERGLDANHTIYALKRAALLIKEIAGGVISGEIQDVYPQKMEPFMVDVTYDRINSLIGKNIPQNTVKSILESLEIRIVSETEEGLSLAVPPYRFDVRKDVDVIEDILRIYGYNNVEISDSVKSNLSYKTATDQSYNLENLIAEQLCGVGFNEILNNSLTKKSYYEELSVYPLANCVHLLNPLSNDLSVMRQTLLFGGMESVSRNIRHQHPSIAFFEFGNCYTYQEDHKKEGETLAPYTENYRLALWLTGNRIDNNWAHSNEPHTVYELKAHVVNLLTRLGISVDQLMWNSFSNEIYDTGVSITSPTGRQLGTLGVVSRKMRKVTDVEQEVFYAELDWKVLMKEIAKNKITSTDLPKFPEVKRDLALLIDKGTAFADITRIARKAERKLLKRVVLFDVYEGKNLPEGKKSYAVSFYLQDEGKTLADKQIDSIMQKIQVSLNKELGADLR